ncbi:MAG: hypothetical protein M1840_003092 [Geoglossum simile]|nr:MAG: hypothetical protein M1840_003092 [Geoglossum simile]
MRVLWRPAAFPRPAEGRRKYRFPALPSSDPSNPLSPLPTLPPIDTPIDSLPSRKRPYSMKTISIALLLFPVAILGTPIASSEASPNIPIGIQADIPIDTLDTWCTLNTSVLDPGCYYDPWHLERRQSVPKVRFGVNCYVEALNVSGFAKWDWIPGWKCWISGVYTNLNCEGKFQCPSFKEAIVLIIRKIIYPNVNDGRRYLCNPQVITPYCLSLERENAIETEKGLWCLEISGLVLSEVLAHRVFSSIVMMENCGLACVCSCEYLDEKMPSRMFRDSTTRFTAPHMPFEVK